MDLVRKPTFDVIALDYMMPDMNGLDVCAELHKSSVSVPIIMLSALDDGTTRRTAEAFGVRIFLTKPVRGRELIDHIKLLSD